MNDQSEQKHTDAPTLTAAEREVARWKHAYETATHDDCICEVNSEHRIQPGCIVHDPLAEPEELPL